MSEKAGIFFPVIDNGLGFGRTSWAISLAVLFGSGVLQGRKVALMSYSYPYPDGAMNLATNDFLADDEVDEMIVIDIDIEFTPQQIVMLLEHDCAIVGGLYPMRVRPVMWPVDILKDNPLLASANGDPLCEVKAIGRGFLRIKKEVFKDLQPHVPRYFVAKGHPNADKECFEFWKGLPGGHSEDINLCYQYREHGGKVYVDRRIRVKHHGSAVYDGSAA